MSNIATLPAPTSRFHRRVSADVQDLGNIILALSQAAKSRPIAVQEDFGADIRERALALMDVAGSLEQGGYSDEGTQAVYALQEAVEWVQRVYGEGPYPARLTRHLPVLQEEIEHLQKLAGMMQNPASAA
jgi:hypothetical protein